MGADCFHVSAEHMDKVEKRRDLHKDLVWICEHAPQAEAAIEHVQRAIDAEAKLAENESWTDAVCNTNNKLSILNNELVDALKEAVIAIDEVYSCVDDYEFPEVCPTAKINKWNVVLAKAKEDTK